MKKSKRAAYIMGWIFLAASMLPGLAAPARSEVISIPLYKLAPAKNIDLRCVKGEHSIFIPIPERWQVNKAVLSFGYVNSVSLLGDISQLAVKVNDSIVAQTRLSPLSPEGSMKVPIPAGLLAPGYNTISFQAVQHYSRDCEHPCSPDLWTTLRLEDASLEIDYTLKAVPLKLSDISRFVYDPKIFPQGRVNIIMEDTSSQTVTAAGVAASGIAMKFDYRKVSFSTSVDIVPGQDNVLIGRKDFVEAFLSRNGIAAGKITGPFLKLSRLPSAQEQGQDQQHSLLVISGVDPKQLKIAAETLAFMNFPYPGTDEMTVEEFSLPKVSLYEGQLMLEADKVYRFKSLGLGTHSFEGFQPNSREISFRLPADFNIRQNQYAELKLNFAYGGGMRPDSVLNVMLNDTRVVAINLSKAGGDSIEGYKINIPTFLFKSGANKIRFVPVLTPQAKECDLIQPESLFLTIYDNSTMYIPPMPHRVKLPSMELFMMNGFPFTMWPDGYGAAMYLANSDRNTVDAALNTVGFITQRNAYPLFGLNIVTGGLKEMSGDSRDMIVLGASDTIPDAIKKGAPIKLLKSSEVPYPVAKGLSGDKTYVSSKQMSRMGAGEGLMMEFQSPYKSGRSVLLLTASSTADLLSLSGAMLEPEVQGRATGDTVLVEFNGPEYKVTSMDVGERYFAGKLGRISMLGMYFYIHPYRYYAVMIVVVLCLSLCVYYLLRRFRKGRAAQGETHEGAAPRKGLLRRAASLLKKTFVKGK